MSFLIYFVVPLISQVVMACALFVIYRKTQKSVALVAAIGFGLAPLAQISSRAATALVDSAPSELVMILLFQVPAAITLLAIIVAALALLAFAIQLPKTSGRDDS